MSNKTQKKQPEEIESAPKPPVRQTRYLVFGIILVFVGLLAVYNGVSSLFDNTTRLLAPNGFISVEVVDTSQERQQGLSGRTEIDNYSGMLFVFDNVSNEHCFWMKDMQFSIDMVWMNEDKEVVTVTPNVAPESYPTSYCPSDNAKYGLELASGNAEKLEITPSVKLRW